MTKPDIDSSSATKTRPAANKTKSSVFSRIATAAKRATGPSTGRRSVSDGLAAVFVEYGKLPVALGSPDQGQQDQKNQRAVESLKARTRIASESALSSSKDKVSTASSNATAPASKAITSPASKVNQFHVDIFTKNVPKPKPQITWPNVGERIKTTPQLALCATLLPKESTVEAEFSEDVDVIENGCDESILDGAPADWVKAMEQPMKQDLIQELAKGTVDEYNKDATKNSDTIAEAVFLAPTLDHEYYRILLIHTIQKFELSPLLDLISLQGLVQVVQSASPGFLEADDLRKILGLVRTRLLSTLQQSTDYVYHLTLAVSRILDVMADNKVNGLDRVTEHESLSAVLSGLKGSSDPFLLYQASYAYQALQYVPHNESTLQGLARHTVGVAESAIKISAVLKLDVGEFFNGLKSLTDVAVTVFESAKAGYEAVCSLIESGQGVFDSLKEGLGAGHRRQWYLAVRQADAFMRGGRVVELNRLIGEAPCRRDPFFQWGICQLLGELAADSAWDVETRKHAVDFLLALHNDDDEWGKDESVRSWTVTLLERLSKLPIDRKISTHIAHQDQAVKDHALALLKTLSKGVAVGAVFRSPYPLRSRLPMPKSSTLLTRVVLDVKFDLDRVRDEVLGRAVQAVYIPPQAKANLKASDSDTFPLMASVKDFLASERQVMLVLGDSGSGKSTFNRHLERELWNNYVEHHFLDEKEPIPLYINLATIENPERDLIDKQLRSHHFSESKIQELKESRRFILICDGYDETKSTSNLYVKNQLNAGGDHWQAKMVISCRSTKLGHEYKSQFMPLPSDTHWGQTADLFQEAVIAPFTPDQIRGYIDQYVLIEHFNQPQWKAQEYNDMLNWIPSLKDMVRNPFLLTLALVAMPNLVGAGRAQNDLQQIKVNRIVLYDAVVQQWINNAKDRLEKSSLSEAEAEALDDLRQFGFKLKVMEYLKGLATDIFKEQDGSPQVLFSGESDAQWKVKYFGRKPETTLLRRSSPLVRNGIQNSFIHLSVLDYFFARVIYDPEQSGDLSLASHPLAQRNILGDPSILQFLAERVQQESTNESPLKRELLAVIEKSKLDESASQAAANAITILVKAGVRFNGANLRGIRIPGADLSGGQFDSAQFQGADLRNVKLAKAWIRQADFSNADMTGVRFGELPHIQLTARSLSCSYSPDGMTFAVGLLDGSIEIYDTAAWTRIRSFSDPIFASDPVIQAEGDDVHLAFSPKGDFLVSGSHRNIFAVWNYHTGELCRTLDGHPGGIASVAVSPDGRQIASTGRDKTVRLWSLHTGEQEFVLTGHTDKGTTVAYSPSGRQIASGDHEGVIRLWNAQTGEAGLVLIKESSGWVHSVAYSPNGRLIASGHRDGHIQLWNAETGQPGHVLVGHAKQVSSVTFSPNNQWVASAGSDFTVRLWDTETGALCNTLTGHSLNVECVKFSPTSPQFASTGLDSTVRIWELQDLYASGPNQGVQNLTRPLPLVAYAPSGQHVISANRGGTLYQWDALSADPQLLRRSEDPDVACMAYSPNGLQIATASNSTDEGNVQLWDLATGKAGLVLPGDDSGVQSIFYSPCSRWIAIAFEEGPVTIYDTQATDARLVHTFNNHACGVAFSPDGGRIALGGFSKKLWVHDASTGKLLATLKGHSEPISGVVYSPNGLLIGSSSWDNTARLWDTTTNKVAVILRGHSNWVQCLAFSTCGKWIATGSRDWTVRLWDVQSSLLSASDQTVESSGVCVSIVQPFVAFVTHLAWNPNGASEFVSASHEHSIRAWKVVVTEEKSKDKDDGQDSADAVPVSVRLDWSSESNSLTGIGTKTAEAKGLNDFDRALLKQRESAKENKLIGEYELVV
ncbi:WD40 repeat-like protein [Linnemannia elongata AG-77]|uniref:WD40 repeat-like protein n=1 Tax=Linnemannia elongata AG-77 TaxID=1314771 RepID=A0A197JKS1_9FUNG|nr:WD40 repeat-like protein [Linnemannia elongata AG-77]